MSLEIGHGQLWAKMIFKLVMGQNVRGRVYV